MAYATADDLDVRVPAKDLGELCFSGVLEDYADEAAFETARGEAVAALTASALADASDLVDGYVSGRYQTPLSPVPGMIRAVCADVAVYALYARRQGAPAHWKKRYEDALAYLKSITSGDITLTGQIAAASSSASFSGNTRRFTRARMEGL